MHIKPNRLWITVLLLGWLFDFLFWKHAPGISFAIYVTATLIAGFILLRGARASLDEIRSSDEFRRLVARAAAVVDDVGVIDAYTDEALAEQMATFRAVSEELGG